MQEKGHTWSPFEDTAAVEKEGRLSEAIDGIRRSIGRNALMLGVHGDGMIKIAQEHCSPHYSTKWEEIPGV